MSLRTAEFLLLSILSTLTLSCHALADSDESAAGLNETVLNITLAPVGIEGFLMATGYRPGGNGPFPLVILTHGTPATREARLKIGRYRVIPQIRAFVDRGYAVVVVVRRGYGATGGYFAEGNVPCTAPHLLEAGLAAAQDLVAAVDYARDLSYVDATKIVLMGQSAGGFVSVAAASLNLPGVVGVLNFSGGRGGDPARHAGVPCGDGALGEVYGALASSIRVPVLWHYVENDQYFGPGYSRAWFAAFVDAGGRGEYVLEPAFGADGHGMFANPSSVPIWLPHVLAFLRELRLPG